MWFFYILLYKVKTKKIKEIKLILVLLICTVRFSSLGQSSSYKCDSVYNFPEITPKYKNNTEGLMDYLRSDLTPIISNYHSKDKSLSLISRMYLTLTINKEGKVVDVVFIKIHTSEACKKELKEKILTMTGWTPGKHGNSVVCSKFYWSTSCIYWK